MRKYFKLFVCIGALIPTQSSADSGWLDYAYISELTPGIHGRYIFKLSNSNKLSGCKNKEMFYQDYDSTGSEYMFDTFLQALTSNKKVSVYVTGKCELNGYSEISSVTIVP